MDGHAMSGEMGPTLSRTELGAGPTSIEFNKLFPDGFHIYHMDSRRDYKSGFERLRFLTCSRQGWSVDLKELNEYQIKEQEPEALLRFLMKRFKQHYFDHIEKDLEFSGKFCLEDVA